jgi:hypothetical protein
VSGETVNVQESSLPTTYRELPTRLGCLLVRLVPWLLRREDGQLADQFQGDLGHLDAAGTLGLVRQLQVLGVAEQLGVGQLQVGQLDLRGVWLAAAAPKWRRPEI